MRQRAAGFRTNTLIALGSAAFTLVSIQMAAEDGGDPTRIPSQIVTGIGFLGGGAILRGQGDIRGLTTAATVWVNAAIGMAPAPASTRWRSPRRSSRCSSSRSSSASKTTWSSAARRKRSPMPIIKTDERTQPAVAARRRVRAAPAPYPLMPYLGAHLSIAGGLPKAVERAEAAGCEALQIFTKSVGQWKARVIDDTEVAQFRDAVSRSSLRAVVAHASYLSNIASPNPGPARAIARGARRRARSVRTPRPARPGHASRHGQRGRRPAADRRRADAAARGAAARPDDDPAGAHGGPGQQPRPPLRASPHDPLAGPRLASRPRASASAWTPVT